MKLRHFKGFHPILEIKHHWFNLKRKIYGKYYWVGPETEIGVCDDCACKRKVGYKLQPKVPVRRVIDCDNLYLCKTHWEKLRTNEDPEIRIDLEPFIKVVK